MKKLKLLTKHWKLMVLVVFGVALLGIIFYMGWNKFQEQRPIVTVGNENIYMKDLNKFLFATNYVGTIEKPLGHSKEDIDRMLAQLIDWKIASQELERRGIKVSDSQIDEFIKKEVVDFEYLSSDQKYVNRLVAKYRLSEEIAKKEIVGWRSGQYLVIHLDRNLESNITADEEQIKLENKGREDRIKRDHEYGNKLAKDLYDKLKSGKISFKEAIEIADSNKVVGADAFLPYSVLRGGEFTKNDWLENKRVFRNEEIKEQVSKISVGNIGSPFIVKVELMRTEGEADGKIFVFKVDEGEKGDFLNYLDFLNAKRYEIKLFNNHKDFFKVIADPIYASGTNIDKSRWGVSSGNNSSAGLAIHARFKNGATLAPLNGVKFKVECVENCGSHNFIKSVGLSCHDSKECDPVSPQKLFSNDKSKQFTTGDPIYYGDVPVYMDRKDPDGRGRTVYTHRVIWNDNINYTADGYIVMGFGRRHSPTRGHAHGNRWSLDCKKRYRVTVISTNQEILRLLGLPDSATGSWDNISLKTAETIINGDIDTFVFTFTVDRPAVYQYKIVASATNSSGATIPLPTTNFASFTARRTAGCPQINQNMLIFNNEVSYFKGSLNNCNPMNATFGPSTAELPPGWKLNLITVNYPNNTTESSPQGNPHLRVIFDDVRFGNRRNSAIITYHFVYTTTETISDWGNINVNCRLKSDTLSGTNPLKVTLKCDNFDLNYGNIDLPDANGRRIKENDIKTGWCERRVISCSRDARGNETCKKECDPSTCTYREWWQYVNNGREGGAPVFRPELTELQLQINWDVNSDPFWSNATKIDLKSNEYLKIDKAWETATVDISRFNFIHHYNSPGEYKIKARVVAAAKWSRTSFQEIISNNCDSCKYCPFIPNLEPLIYPQEKFNCKFPDPNGHGLVDYILVSVAAWNDPHMFEPAP